MRDERVTACNGVINQKSRRYINMEYPLHNPRDCTYVVVIIYYNYNTCYNTVVMALDEVINHRILLTY